MVSINFNAPMLILKNILNQQIVPHMSVISNKNIRLDITNRLLVLFDTKAKHKPSVKRGHWLESDIWMKMWDSVMI